MTALVILKNLHLICIFRMHISEQKKLAACPTRQFRPKISKRLAANLMWWKGWSENYSVPLTGGSSFKSLGWMSLREGRKQPLNQENISSGCVYQSFLCPMKWRPNQSPSAGCKMETLLKPNQSNLQDPERQGIQTQHEPIILQLCSSLRSLYTRKVVS